MTIKMGSNDSGGDKDKNPPSNKTDKPPALPNNPLSRKNLPRTRPPSSAAEKAASQKADFPKPLAIKTPQEIDAHLSQYIIGQERARKIVSLAGYYHLRYLEALNKGDKRFSKSNVMLVGPTGSGKTEIVRRLSEIISLPMNISDCSSFTASGYYGRDPDSCVADLIAKIDEPLLNFQGGIIVLDEVDKVARSGAATGRNGTKDIGGESVQQQLLKIVEGSEVEVKGTRGVFSKESFNVDTSRILFIAAGAFSDIHVMKKTPKKTVGFGSYTTQESEDLGNPEDIDVETLVKAGMLPEFMGRFPVIAQLRELTVDNMLQILTQPKNAIVSEFRDRLLMDNVKLIVEEESLRTIAEYSLKRAVGARGLRAIMERVFFEVLFEAPGNPGSTFTLDDQYTKERLGLSDKILIGG